MSQILRILIIEDDATDYRLLVRYLRQHDLQFAVRRVVDSEELQSALKSHRWDLVLTDYSLPDIDIRERLQSLMEALPDAPVIMVSGTIGEEIAVDLLRAGIEDYVNKDNLARLIPAIQRARRACAERQTRRATELALQRSERRYKQLYEQLSRSRWQQDLFSSTSQDVMFLLDAHGKLLWWNPRLEALTVVATDTLHGRTATAFIAEPDHPTTRRALQKTLNDGYADLEARLTTLQGDIYFQFRSNRAEHEGVVYIAGIGQDVTERRAADEALRLSEARLKEAQAVARMGSWVLDVEQDSAYWSEQIYRMFELEPDVTPGPETLRTLVHPEDWPRIESAMERSIRHQAPYHVQYRVITPRANTVWIDCRAALEENSAGKVVKLKGVVQDITEQRINESRLRQSATVFENTAEGVFITDASGNILDTNPAFGDITGFSKEDVLGNNPRLWRSDRHDADFYRSMWRDINECGQWQGEIWNRRKDGSVFPEWLNISAVRDNEGNVVNFVAVFTDITALKRSQEKLEHLAHYDALTDLPNRLLLQARLDHAIAHAQRTDTNLALIFIDLDRFKNINDSFGHPAGDDLLKEVAQRLLRCVRSDDTVARIGGDEFVLLLEAVKHPDKSVVVANKVQQTFSEPVEINNQSIHVTASMGICTYPQDGEEGATLLRNADAAMYRAKEDGRSVYRFYTEELTTNAVERIMLENHMRNALDRNEFHLAYQPQVDLRTGRVCGVEALLRWKHPAFEHVSPTKFIPLAEETGLIQIIGAWVLKHACTQARQWITQGIEFGRIAINVSGAQFQREGFVDTVKDVLKATGLPANRLELEVTENFIMQHMQHGLSELDQLRERGVMLAIDDFGTGYSSLAQLKSLPINKLKIDQSFIRDMPEDSDDCAICSAIIAMCVNLRLSVTAEGVETPEQNRYLRDQGCTMAQGFFYSHPQSSEDLTQWLSQRSAALAAGEAAHSATRTATRPG